MRRSWGAPKRYSVVDDDDDDDFYVADDVDNDDEWNIYTEVVLVLE